MEARVSNPGRLAVHALAAAVAVGSSSFLSASDPLAPAATPAAFEAVRRGLTRGAAGRRLPAQCSRSISWLAAGAGRRSGRAEPALPVSGGA